MIKTWTCKGLSMPEINKKIQKGNWNCRGEEKYHPLLVQPHFKCYRLISPQVQWMLHHEWAHTICCPTCVYQYFQIRILGKLTMSTRISDTGQVHNLYSGRLVVCCSIAPEVWQHQQPARIQILVRVQNYITFPWASNMRNKWSSYEMQINQQGKIKEK
jgi:hypothetical protein